ncbi:hypothetical protein PGIGA_G00048300 [Pangasianodon gigas]|uniref:Uncharacterized protein n=1 Tax=Pangasianodon gigas TaxID=30993 RepID=A0ACC5X1V8_PANGG|nr:hypothetical protein [Pangasianodon gigas]
MHPHSLAPPSFSSHSSVARFRPLASCTPPPTLSGDALSATSFSRPAPHPGSERRDERRKGEREGVSRRDRARGRERKKGKNWFPGPQTRCHLVLGQPGSDP